MTWSTFKWLLFPFVSVPPFSSVSFVLPGATNRVRSMMQVMI
jgi:hypothetical protein